MPSLQSLRRKIGAVKNTQKITKAMKMVAAAKLKRAQDRILAARPYGHKMREVIANLSKRVNRGAHPLLQKRTVRNIEVLIVTSDRGLCGAFNANIVRKALECLRETDAKGVKVTVSLVGRKGREYFRRRPWPIRQEWLGVFDRLTYEHGIDIGQDLIEHFTKGTFDELYVIYNEFKSAIQQRVIVEKLFPIEAHGARMAAMDGATRNAGELIKKLTLYYNKTRQAAITKELMDIVGGAEALK